MYIIILFFICSCVQTPQKPEDNNIIGNGNVLVLCEGLMGYNNATISNINQIKKEIDNNFFASVNKTNDLLLGDTANDFVKKGDTVFAAVTGSGVITAFRFSDGQFLGRIHLEKNYENASPRAIVIVNDTLAYCTSLYRHSIFEFNPKTIELNREIPDIGFFPEGIDYADGKLFIANSCLGIYNNGHQLAGTISVYNIHTYSMEAYIYAGSNIQELLVDTANNKLYACYYNTFETDSIGGIIEYDLFTLERTKIIKGFFQYLTLSNNKLFFINQLPPGSQSNYISMVAYIDLQKDEFEITPLVENSKKNEFWYSIGIDNNYLWIGNAKNFQNNGEVILYDLDNPQSPISTYVVGINPTKFLFRE